MGRRAAVPQHRQRDEGEARRGEGEEQVPRPVGGTLVHDEGEGRQEEVRDRGLGEEQEVERAGIAEEVAAGGREKALMCRLILSGTRVRRVSPALDRAGTERAAPGFSLLCPSARRRSL